MKTTNLFSAITDAQSGAGNLVIRPRAWQGSGRALAEHGGGLFPHPVGSSPAPALSVVELVNRWQVLSVVELELERSGEQAPRKPRKSRRKPAGSGGKRGRPSAESVAAAFPGWCGIATAAVELGISRDRLRRAAADGLVTVRRENGAALVQLDECRRVGVEQLRKLVPARRNRSTSPAVETASVSGSTTPAVETASDDAADSFEVFQ